MDLNVGNTVYLSQVQRIMTDEQFEDLLVGKSENTTIPYMRHAQNFIVRGLLSRGSERRAFGVAKEIIAGAYTANDGAKEGRIFLVENAEKATLLWKGPLKEFRANYMRIRDEFAGPVYYRLHGKAAAKRHKVVEHKS
jgi:hypothetical protein